jgi:dsDNA-specific endonuclease/ATPase MutS2
MKTHVMISQELSKQIGINALTEACNCRTPQGRRLKNALRFYPPSELNELQSELQAVENLRNLIVSNHPEVIEAQTQLSRLRELRGTLSRLEKRTLLDDTEFFELKSALKIFFRLNKLKTLLKSAGLHLMKNKDASRLLDPSGTGNPAFHIYSAYSPTLADIRDKKRKLEREITVEKGHQRQTLLWQRALLIEEENKIEEEIRLELGEKLLKFLPEIRHNTEVCAILDFRLAKADLAIRWKGIMPSLVENDQPTVIENVTHPVIAEMLDTQGQKFTPVTIKLHKGSTVLSGANMGGKSIALKTVFFALLMCQLGYFPSCEEIQTPLFDFMAFVSNQDGDINRGLSSFGLEAVQIREHHQRSQSENGLIVMDEPCRGTNPAEATAIVQALCNIYGRSSSTFFIATHYHVNPNPGINFYQVRGIRPESLSELPPHRVLDEEIRDEKLSKSYDPRDDIKRIRRIQALMDYRLEEIDGSTSAPSGAIKIAELLGVDDELLHEMKAAWQEEEWQN